MPADHPSDPARDLERALSERALSHLKVRARGKQLTITTAEDDWPEARLTLIAPQTRRLDVATDRGGWEQTPFAGDIPEMVDAAISIGRLAE
jgi:hypothetical protein